MKENGFVRVSLEAAETPLAGKILEILGRKLMERTGLKLKPAGREAPDIALGIEDGIGEEGYRIETGPGGMVRVAGNDGRGLLYGVGRLLRDARLAPGRFEPGAWRGASAPRLRVRGRQSMASTVACLACICRIRSRVAQRMRRFWATICRLVGLDRVITP